MDTLLIKLQVVTAAFTGTVAAVYGSAGSVIYALLLFLAIDYVTGIVKAIVKKEVASEVGVNGLFKKGMILVVLIVATTLDMVALKGTGVVAAATAIFFMVNEAISITENAAAIGVPIPKKLMALLSQLRGENDE